MDNQFPIENAVAAIRVSSLKQGLQGDSPDAQKEQIDRFAATHNFHIKKYFVFLESASKEQQPVQEAIDYCKDSKNNIQLFVIKSIDRFTRGGSYSYDHLKMQLNQCKVKLIDIYGIIGTQEVNTLEHLGVEYNWSVYSPTKKSEILEAERAKDEMRDIMSRMIGAEIRYVRLGYRVRTAPIGYVNEKIETAHGKRVILKLHPEESKWIIRMYELRAQGNLSDEKIVEEINNLGYRSRRMLKRSPQDRTKVLGEKGGKKLKVKQMQEYLKNTLYAGVSFEKWTQGEAIKCRFPGLVSFDLFNKANRGKMIIVEEEGEVKVYKDRPLDWRLKKCVKNPLYPYKRFVLCPQCKNPFLGSASKGKSGKYFPAYHCSRKHKSFRIPVDKFEETIKDFLSRLKITSEGITKAKGMVIEEWDKRIAGGQKEASILDNKLAELEGQIFETKETLKKMTSEISIKMIEEDLIKVVTEKAILEEAKKKQDEEVVDMEVAAEIVSEYMEHLGELVIGSPDPLDRAAYFGMLFQETPTYQQLVNGTPKLEPYIELISTLSGPNSPLARPR